MLKKCLNLFVLMELLLLFLTFFEVFTFCLSSTTYILFITLSGFIIQPAVKYPNTFSEESLFGR